MHLHLVFGGCLASEIAFAELEAHPPAAARWTLRIAAAPLEVGESELIGTDVIDQTIAIRLFRHDAGFRLEFDDTGCFDVVDGGSRIFWVPGAGADPQAARLDVLGRVLPLALHLSGTLCLHGSAVALGQRGVSFLAPPGYGKSTLARALVSTGGLLATDDAAPIAAGPCPLLLPGVPGLRLWKDAFERLRGSPAELAIPSGAKLLARLPAECVLREAVQLEAIYLLAPVLDGAGRSAAERERLPARVAALALVRHAKLGQLLLRHPDEARKYLRTAAALAERIPVWQLRVVRDLDRLAEVVEVIAGWHPAVVTATP